MFKRVLVPLDGSKRAESAIPVAARIARAPGGSVILLQIAAIPVEFQSDVKPAWIYSKEAIDKALADTKSYLEDLAKSETLEGIPVETEVISGAVAPSILSAIQSHQADLVVMCSHGYTGFKRWALGSVAHKVVPHSPVPVLVLRDGGPIPATASQKPMRAFVPLDGSPLSEAALEPAAQLLAALAPSGQRALHLIRVVDIPSSYGKFRSDVDAHYDAGVRAEAKREHEAYLAGVENRFKEGELVRFDLSLTTSVAIDTDVAEAIVQAAEQAEGTEFPGYTLIAMATHGRGGVQRWVLGSVTERVLHTTRLPLLIVHPVHLRHDTHKEVETGAQQLNVGS